MLKIIGIIYCLKSIEFLTSTFDMLMLPALQFVGRATVPADTGRHADRPYDSTGSKFFSD
jgi:hypothetical protein